MIKSKALDKKIVIKILDDYLKPFKNTFVTLMKDRLTIPNNCCNKLFSHFSSNIFRENSREQTKIIVYCLQLYDAWVIIDINKKLRELKLYLQFLFMTHNCLNCCGLLFCN